MREHQPSLDTQRSRPLEGCLSECTVEGRRVPGRMVETVLSSRRRPVRLQRGGTLDLSLRRTHAAPGTGHYPKPAANDYCVC